MKTRTMYMHTLDGKPASFTDMHGHPSIYFAGAGHQSRAAVLVPTRRQLDREQQAARRDELARWNALSIGNRGPHPVYRYDFVLVKVPA